MVKIQSRVAWTCSQYIIACCPYILRSLIIHLQFQKCNRKQFCIFKIGFCIFIFIESGGFMWSLPWNPGQPGLCIWASCLHVYIQDRTIKSWKFISSPSKKRTPIVWSFLHIRFEMQGKMKKKSTFEFGYLVQCGFSKDVHCNVHCKSNLIINKLSYPYSCAWLKERFRFT